MPLTRRGGGHCRRHRARQRSGRLRARTQLRAGGEAGDADPRAPHGQADRQGRKPHAVERPVRRPRARHRQRVRFRSASRPRSTRRRCWPRSTAIRSAARSRSRAAPCRCSTSTISRARRISRSTRGRPAHPRVDRPAAGAAGLERLVRPVVGGRRRCLARRLRHRLPHARRERGFAVPDTAFKLALERLRNFVGNAEEPRKTAAAISLMRSMCWRGTAPRRSAICAISPTPSSTTSRPRSPRRRSPPRSACSATARAPSASMRRRCARSRRSRCWNTAAPTMARSCATRRRW